MQAGQIPASEYATILSTGLQQLLRESPHDQELSLAAKGLAQRAFQPTPAAPASPTAPAPTPQASPDSPTPTPTKDPRLEMRRLIALRPLEDRQALAANLLSFPEPQSPEALPFLDLLLSIPLERERAEAFLGRLEAAGLPQPLARLQLSLPTLDLTRPADRAQLDAQLDALPPEDQGPGAFYAALAAFEAQASLPGLDAIQPDPVAQRLTGAHHAFRLRPALRDALGPAAAWFERAEGPPPPTPQPAALPPGPQPALPWPHFDIAAALQSLSAGDAEPSLAHTLTLQHLGQHAAAASAWLHHSDTPQAPGLDPVAPLDALHFALAIPGGLDTPTLLRLFEQLNDEAVRDARRYGAHQDTLTRARLAHRVAQRLAVAPTDAHPHTPGCPADTGAQPTADRPHCDRCWIAEEATWLSHRIAAHLQSNKPPAAAPDHDPSTRLRLAFQRLNQGDAEAAQKVATSLSRHDSLSPEDRHTLARLWIQLLRAELRDDTPEHAAAYLQRGPRQALLLALSQDPLAAYNLHTELLHFAQDPSRHGLERLLSLKAYLGIWAATETPVDPEAIAIFHRREPALLWGAALSLSRQTDKVRALRALLEALPSLEDSPARLLALTAPA